MKVKELRELTKEELINKYISKCGNYSAIHNRYQELKGDIYLIKRQLENITNNIDTKKNHKYEGRVVYHKGGKVRKENETQ